MFIKYYLSKMCIYRGLLRRGFLRKTVVCNLLRTYFVWKKLKFLTFFFNKILKRKNDKIFSTNVFFDIALLSINRSIKFWYNLTSKLFQTFNFFYFPLTTNNNFDTKSFNCLRFIHVRILRFSSCTLQQFYFNLIKHSF